MDGEPAYKLKVNSLASKDANLVTTELVLFGSPLNEGPIKVVSIVGRENSGLCLQDVIEKAPEKTALIWFIENSEHANVIFRFGRVLEVLYILTNDLSVRNEEAL